MKQPKQRSCGSKNDSDSTTRALTRRIRLNRVEDDGRTININVIFHICFERRSITEREIQLDCEYTIEMLNRDYNMKSANFDSSRRLFEQTNNKEVYNTYLSRAASCNIEFNLKRIIHLPLPSISSSNIDTINRKVKGEYPPIEPTKNLNIWVVNMNNGLLGYAQFPWELEDRPTTDGVVLSAGTFGRRPSFSSYNLNKTATHEIGHWLGLYHIFQETFNYDGGVVQYLDNDDPEEYKGDCIADTPCQGRPTYGDPTMSPNRWPCSRPTDEPEEHKHMFMNFMDYSDDRCMFMFTADQATKIRQLISIYRPELNFVNNNLRSTGQPVDLTNPLTGQGILRIINKLNNPTHSFVMDLSLCTDVRILISAKQFRVRLCRLNEWYVVESPITAISAMYSIPLPIPYVKDYIIEIYLPEGEVADHISIDKRQNPDKLTDLFEAKMKLTI